MSQRLPPLNSIRAFEAAARHRSISRAADELLVTHGAVSKQVKNLENYLGKHLFERSSTGLVLTTAGLELAAALGPIFKALQATFGGYVALRRNERVCRLSTVPSFAAQFLVPRMRSFREVHPDISLQILTSAQLVDFERERVDIAVRYGTGDWKDVVSEPLGGGTLLAVCAPSLMKGLEPEDPYATLLSMPLIHSCSTSDWSAWIELAALGYIDAESGLFIEDFNVAIRATIAGQGACLLPTILIQSELNAGVLCAISSLELAVNRQYFLVRPQNTEQSTQAATVAEWLGREIRLSMKSAGPPEP